MEAKILTERCIRFSLKPLERWELYSYAIIGNHNIYIIDSGCGKGDALYILDFLNKYTKDKQIILINTHYHWDHIWGNKYFNTKMIISLDKCYDKIQTNWDYMLTRNKEYVNIETELCLPTITFTDKLYLKEDNIMLFASTGHTLDGICIYDEIDNILYVGDNIGDDDVNIIPELESTKSEYLSSLEVMKELNPKLVLSGHNEIQDVNFITKIIEKIKGDMYE